MIKMFLTKLFKRFEAIFKKINLPFYKKDKYKYILNEDLLKSYVKHVISDAILFNETPSPTENEEQRQSFIIRRLNEFGITNYIINEDNSVIVSFPATEHSAKNILLISDLQSEFYSPLDSMVKLKGNRMYGDGLINSSIGTAALLVLAEYLVKNNISFSFDTHLVFVNNNTIATGYSGLYNLLKEWGKSITGVLIINSVMLGEIGSLPLGKYKFLVEIKANDKQKKTPLTAKQTSAIDVLSKIVMQIKSMEWDMERTTTIDVVRISSGLGFDYFPAEGILEIEILSKKNETLRSAKNAVSATIQKIAEESSCLAEINVYSEIPVIEDPPNEQLIKSIRSIHSELKIKSSLSMLHDKQALINLHGIPALNVGLTTGEKTLEYEYINILPLKNGFKQLLLILNKIDEKQMRMAKLRQAR